MKSKSRSLGTRVSDLRKSCPLPDDLVTCSEGIGVGRVREHVRACSWCRSELDLLFTDAELWKKSVPATRGIKLPFRLKAAVSQLRITASATKIIISVLRAVDYASARFTDGLPPEAMPLALRGAAHRRPKKPIPIIEDDLQCVIRKPDGSAASGTLVHLSGPLVPGKGRKRERITPLKADRKGMISARGLAEGRYTLQANDQFIEFEVISGRETVLP